MDHLKRAADLLGPPDADPIEMATTISACFQAQAEAIERSDNAGAVAALHLLDRLVRDFAEAQGTRALYAAVSHWAARLAPEKQVLIIAAFFADPDTMNELVRSLNDGRDSPGIGLALFTEGLNRAGLVLSPSYFDQVSAGLQAKAPAPAEPLSALAEVIWPVSDSETALREALARATGLPADTIAGELFAVRDAGFNIGALMALQDEKRLEILTNKVHTLVDQRLRDIPVPGNWQEWQHDRAARYRKVVGGLQDEPSNVKAVKWLDNVRSVFKACLGTEDRAVGQVGSAEYDRTRHRSSEICSGFDPATTNDELPVIWGDRKV